MKARFPRRLACGALAALAAARSRANGRPPRRRGKCASTSSGWSRTAGFPAERRRARTRRAGEPAAFLRRQQVTTDDPVYLEGHAGDSVERRAHQRARARSHPAAIPWRRSPPAPDVPRNALPVVGRALRGDAAGLPQLAKSSAASRMNAPSSNFGCADTTNLCLMVADPRDLVIGRALGPAGAEPGFARSSATAQGQDDAAPWRRQAGQTYGGGGAERPGGGGRAGTHRRRSRHRVAAMATTEAHDGERRARELPRLHRRRGDARDRK